MTPVAEALAAFDGKSTAVLRALVDSADASDVLAACDRRDTEVGATWLAKAMIEKRAGGLHPADLIARLERVEAWQAQLHILQCVHHAPEAAVDHVAILRQLMESHKTLVRVWALDAFVRVARVRTELKGEAADKVRAALDAKQASLRARARHLESLT